MAVTTSNLTKTLLAVAQLEVKALRAGIECWQVWAEQASVFSDLASETVLSFRNGQGSFSITAKRLSALGKESSDKYADLSKRLSQSYFDEVGKLIESFGGDKSSRSAQARKSPRARRTKSGKRR